MGKNQYVVRSGNKWGVRGEGNERLTSTHDTQAAAIEAGRKIAVNQQSELLVQGRNGQFRSKDSYGPDNCPPRDTEH